MLEALESGALASAANAATFSGFMHFIRLFGGQIGTAAMNRIVTVRERFHDNALGLHIQAGNWLTDERLRALTAGLFSPSSGSDEAQSRAIGILSQQVRGQAYTMAISDGFVVICWMVVIYLLLLLLSQAGEVQLSGFEENDMNRAIIFAAAVGIAAAAPQYGERRPPSDTDGGGASRDQSEPCFEDCAAEGY